MKLTYKYRIYANKDALNNASKWINICHKLYNWGLEQRIMAHKEYNLNLSCYDQINQLPKLKIRYPEYKQISSQTLQEVCERLDKAYQTFFRRVKNGEKAGFPRFKSSDRYDSFTLKNTGWKLEDKYLTIRNIGRFKLRLSRPIEGVIKTITIHRNRVGYWYACFSCDKVPERKLEQNINSIGIDVGVKSFLVDSDNNCQCNPNYFKNAEKQLRTRQRKLSRRLKGSNRRIKARILVAKAHEKVANQRDYFLHKLANYYIANYGIIYIEDLNIKGMAKHQHLAKSISDASWGKFFEILNYKAEEAGRKVIKVPRFEPTSKTCSECGAINQELTLSDRQWICKSCGVLHDRDYNAAKNILRVGQTLQELTYSSS